jgi:hypothetical protein
VNSVNPRLSLSRWAFPRLIVIALVGALMVILSATASLAACPPTDPLCIVDEASQLEDPLPGTSPVDDAKEAIDDVVDKAKGEVDKVVGPVTDPVTEPVDELLDPGGEKPGGEGGGGGGDRGGRGDGSTGPPGDPGRDDAAGSPGGISTGAALPGTLVPVPASVPATPRVSRDQPGVFGRLGGAAAEVAKQLGFPLALAVIVLAFAAIQNYLDRRDPKLALAPVRPEVMRFE